MSAAAGEPCCPPTVSAPGRRFLFPAGGGKGSLAPRRPPARPRAGRETARRGPARAPLLAAGGAGGRLRAVGTGGPWGGGGKGAGERSRGWAVGAGVSPRRWPARWRPARPAAPGLPLRPSPSSGG